MVHATSASGVSTDIDWTTEDELDFGSDADIFSSPSPQKPVKEDVANNNEASSLTGTSCSEFAQQFIGMGFPRERVLEVIDEHRVEDENLVLSYLLTCFTANPIETPRQQVGPCSPTSSSYYENYMDDDDQSDMDSWFEDETRDINCTMHENHKMLPSLAINGSLSDSKMMVLSFVDMGYLIEEAEIALRRCGPEASTADLIDFIYAAQTSREADFNLPEDDLRQKHMLNGNITNKKRKLNDMKKKNALEVETMRIPRPMIGFGMPTQQPERIDRFIPDVAKGRPYFYYENVALAAKGTWDIISRHLYDIEPEFVDSKYFCAAAQGVTYTTFLLRTGFLLFPYPPMTIYEAFPLSRKHWPSWDVRVKMNCIQTVVSIAKETKEIQADLAMFDTIPPEPVQKRVLERCRKNNLVWIGKKGLLLWSLMRWRCYWVTQKTIQEALVGPNESNPLETLSRSIQWHTIYLY